MFFPVLELLKYGMACQKNALFELSVKFFSFLK